MAHGSSPTIAQEPEVVKFWQKGDVHPETGEVFIAYDRRCTTGERWSRVEKLPADFYQKLEAKKAHREWQATANGKWSPHRQWSRGDIHPDTGLVFWAYNRHNATTEKWLTPEEFAISLPAATKRSSDYALANPEATKKKHRRYYARNKKKCVESSKRWVRKNRSRVNKHCKHRYDNDPLYQLKRRLRARTRFAFLNSPFKKNSKTFAMLGCSQEELLKHIAQQFTEGMSWDRLGEIEIDHRIPLASAQTEEELIALCHYTNLQPLWAEHNRSKGAKMPVDLTHPTE